jgi:hypothetical protein
MTLPNPYPLVPLPVFEVSFSGLFGPVQAQIQAMRQARQQPPLVPNGGLLYGQENEATLVSAPAILVVPTGFRIRTSADRNMPDVVEPILLYSQWMVLRVWCWGDDDPNRVNPDPLYAFSTATELARQLIVALCDNQYGPAHVVVDRASWVQNTDVNRQGRVLELDVAVETFLVRDANIQMPVATNTTPGIQASVTVSGQSPDGSQTQAEATFVVPPSP